MSQGLRAAPIAATPKRPPLLQPIDPDKLGNSPSIYSRDEAVAFCNEVFGVRITPTRMRRGFERSELVFWKIGGVNATSPRALWDWIQGMARPVAGGDR